MKTTYLHLYQKVMFLKMKAAVMRVLTMKAAGMKTLTAIMMYPLAPVLVVQEGPFSYLDDVQFKISDKFKTPPKVGLPMGFKLQDYHILLAECEYDFTPAKRIIEWGKEIEQMRLRQEEAELATSTRDRQENVPEVNQEDCTQIETSGPPLSAIHPILAGLRHNDILTPLPAPSIAVSRQRDLSPPPSHNSTFNLADFECEEDPFDKLELKTINDKEELRNILQVVSIPESTEVTVSDTKFDSSKFSLIHKPNGLITLLQLNSSESSKLSPLGPGTPFAALPCNIRSLSFPKLSDSEEHPSASMDNKNQNIMCSSRSSERPVSLPNGSASRLTAVLKDKSNVQTSRHGFPVDKSGTSATIFHTGVLPESLCNKQVKQHAQSVSSKTHSAVSSNSVDDVLSVGAVLKALSPSERECVETLVGMGYPSDSVIRAIQKQGQNVDEVLDYLLVYGRLCERGFDAGSVEECLDRYSCSEEKALEFLQLMSKFQEMGFEQNMIKQALIIHGSNQEKALEELVARGGAS
ncbi:ubiquitin-associated protein 1 [Polypterus senegalus]|uniref:ubiquitin-associated protein 1 n=1 Tax=Polypterus senegalus TaxID=55291 RepID=UPI001966659E|nr:ubiquitin-associated protein 1 [Polypterus senegalus]